MAGKWSTRIATLPDDGLPVIIEEMYPLGGAKGVAWPDMVATYVSSTAPRTVGWMSFYWGPSKKVYPKNAIAAAIYEEWLG